MSKVAMYPGLAARTSGFQLAENLETTIAYHALERFATQISLTLNHLSLTGRSHHSSASGVNQPHNQPLQWYLAHHSALCIVLLQGPRRALFLMTEVSLYAFAGHAHCSSASEASVLPGNPPSGLAATGQKANTSND